MNKGKEEIPSANLSHIAEVSLSTALPPTLLNNYPTDGKAPV